MNPYDLGFKAGLAFGCASNGVSATTLRKSAACTRACAQNNAVQVQLAKIAGHICRNAGPDFTKLAATYDAIVNRQGTQTKVARAMFIEPVLHTLAGITKTAGLGELLTGAVNTVNAGQDMVYKSALLSALAGAGLGTLGWTIFRDIKEDDATAEAKHEQARMYRRIAKDLQKRIKAQAETDKDMRKLRKTIEEEGDSNYVL